MVLRLLTVLFLLHGAVHAQQLFHKVTGTGAPDFGNAGMQVYDNGFVAVGSTGGGGQGNSDILLVRTDVDGNLKWQKSVGFPQVEQGYSVQNDSDSGFVIAGYTNSFGLGGYDVLLVKTDTAGNVSWSKSYGGADWDLGYKVMRDASGGFTIAGQSFSGGSGNGDGYLVHTDEDGTLLWEKRFGGTEEDGFFNFRQTQDGGYVLCGHSKSFNSGGVKELYVVRLDNTGSLIWEKTVGDTLEGYATDIEENYDGGFVAVGAGKASPDSTHDDVIVVRLAANGMLKRREIQGWKAGETDKLNSICKMPGDKFFAVGETSYNGTFDVWLTSIDSSGALMGNAKTWGDDDPSRSGTKDQGNFVMATNDNRFLVVGTTEGYMTGVNKNLFIGTGDMNTNGGTVSDPQVYVDVKTYTSPEEIIVLNNGQGRITCILPEDFKLQEMKLYNINGQLVQADVTKWNSEFELYMAGNAPGLYILSLTGEERSLNVKVINP